MRKIKMISVLMLAVLLIGVLTLGVSAEQYPDYLVSVTDKDNLLSTEDERRINEALLAATEAAGIPVCAYVFASDVGYYGRVEYFGDDFLSEHGLSRQDELILLVVAVTHYEVYYDLYLYGDAWDRINQKERDYILDDSRVYNNLKNARIADGLCAYASVSAEAYVGRLGVSWQLILIVALIAGAIAGGVSVSSIAASYKKKNPSQSYPLDRFAKLELTRERDREIGKFVTTTIISSGSRCGHGGGRGGGGGHAGGR
jgi:uncharacterized membrane protein YgcG